VAAVAALGALERRIETDALRVAHLYGPDHGVGDYQDGALGAVFAVRGLVLAPDGNREGAHDTLRVVVGDAVKVGAGHIWEEVASL